MEDTPQSELESFRRQWQEEVAAKTKKHDGRSKPSPATRPGASGPGRPSKTTVPTLATVLPIEEEIEGPEFEGRVYNDLEDKEEHLKLANDTPGARELAREKEPRSALEHYERGVERETQGSLGDSVSHYRKAFKLDSKVHEAYKAKHFPASSFPTKPQNTNPSNASATVPGTAHHSLEGSRPDIKSLIHDFSSLLIKPAQPETDLSTPPPCPIADVPHEILIQILRDVAVRDIASFGRVARICKRFAYLVMTEDPIWKRIALGHEFGFAAMHYTYVCNLKGRPLESDTLLLPDVPPAPTFRDLTPSAYPTYRAQFRHRPRLRFNGCYISTVNYTRPGLGNQSRFTWTDPVQIVTYYRYLRFFRDGSCISLLTTSEPADVVHYMTKENVHKHHAGGLPSVVMKDALRGRWRLSGPSLTPTQSTAGSFVDNELDLDFGKGPGEYTREPLSGGPDEEEGDVLVETEGVIPKYMWKMLFVLGSAGRKDGPRNGKLNWKGFWSYNRLTDDWGEFGLKNDRSFYFSRVKSYGMGYPPLTSER